MFLGEIIIFFTFFTINRDTFGESVDLWPVSLARWQERRRDEFPVENVSQSGVYRS